MKLKHLLLWTNQILPPVCLPLRFFFFEIHSKPININIAIISLHLRFCCAINAEAVLSFNISLGDERRRWMCRNSLEIAWKENSIQSIARMISIASRHPMPSFSHSISQTFSHIDKQCYFCNFKIIISHTLTPAARASIPLLPRTTFSCEDSSRLVHCWMDEWAQLWFA